MMSPASPLTPPSQPSLKPSIFVILLILSITLLLSISLCLLLRLLNRRCLRHLSTTTTSSFSSSSRLPGHRVSPEISLIHSLPLFTFNSIKRPPSTPADCAVCLSKFEPHDQLRLLPLCCHAFHAHCIDTWLLSNQTCPLCRSLVHASESDIIRAISTADSDPANGSFRLEIGSVSRSHSDRDSVPEAQAGRSSYSLGSFEYIVEEESEINTTSFHRRSVSDKDIGTRATNQPSLADEADSVNGRNWLKDYIDRLSSSLSSRTLSFRSSGRFFTGSSRRTEIAAVEDYDMEGASRMGEEISELFRWLSGV